MAKSLSFLDRSFWLTETKNNPKHVACLQFLTKPDNAAQDYCTKLISELKEHKQGFYPFDQRVISFMRIAIGFKKVKELDMDYHVQHHKIDDVTDQVALHKFTAKLHEPMLDRRKPLWQIHVIEGGNSQEYVIFFTIHHVYGDGASLVKWFQESYQDKPSENFLPAWAIKRQYKPRLKKNPFTSFFLKLWHFVISIFDIAFIFFRLLLKLLRIYPVYMPIPFSGTKTMLTGQVTSGRVVATTSIDFSAIKTLSLRMRASANEILLCCFDIAVHKFLKDHDHVFDRPLITQMPINMRKPTDPVGGNKIAIVPVQLAYGKKDPYLRLRQIIENHRIVKGVAKRVYPAAFSYYTILIQGMALIFESLRLSALFKPLGNILISNVPGPKKTKYFRDSRLNGMHPISTLTPGGGVNITLLTYQNKADIGLVCCDKEIKSLEPLAEHFQEAFALLSQSVDNPNLTIDDLAEMAKTPHKSVLDEQFHHQNTSFFSQPEKVDSKQ
ncbi:MAG: wax ester/triacylglycerol synthase family O-acyltransferase [Litorilituus sp.]|jgi:WS/DGAT/MGAT family acyltransferase|nr:wax ester/triacylglycerol synthase family O-acyltransferase [Litorilituus sp.]